MYGLPGRLYACGNRVCRLGVLLMAVKSGRMGLVLALLLFSLVSAVVGARAEDHAIARLTPDERAAGDEQCEKHTTFRIETTIFDRRSMRHWLEELKRKGFCIEWTEDWSWSGSVFIVNGDDHSIFPMVMALGRPTHIDVVGGVGKP